MINLVWRGWIGPSASQRGQIFASDIERILADAPTDALHVAAEIDGGFVEEATRVYALVAAHRGPTSIVVRSRCNSAGVIAALGFQRRICSPSATFLLHRPRFWPEDLQANSITSNRLRAWADVLDNAEIAMAELLAERTDQKFPFWRDRLLDDPGCVITSSEARSAGLVHAIVATP